MRLSLTFLFLIFSFVLKAQQYEIKKLGIKEGISSNYVLSVTQDKRGFLWFATESGLNRFDGNTFKIFKKNQAVSSISGNELNRVYADRFDDLVWIATQREGLNMFDCSTETFTHFKNDGKDPNSLITDDITDVVNAEDGNLWLSTYHRGVEYFDKKTKKFTHYNVSTVPGLPDDKVWAVNEDKRGNLYIGHVNSGLSVLSVKTKKVKNFRHNPSDAGSLPGNEVRTVFIDREQNIWVGTNDGLAMFIPEKERFVIFRHHPGINTSLISNSIYAINQLNDGKLWIGTEKGGASILDIRRSMFISPQHAVFENITYRDDNRGVSNATVRSIFQDSFNNIWFGTYGGGVNFMGHRPSVFNSWSYSPVQSLSDVLTNSTAWGITADSDDNLWVGTDGGGINIFSNGNRIRVINRRSGGLKDDAILAATRDSEQNLWFGSFRGDVQILNNRGQTLHYFNLNGQDVRCFYEDSDKNMWIGGTFGLYRYNLVTREGKLVSPVNSSFANNLVRAIVKDSAGRLWVGFFGGGLVLLDKDLHILRKYSTANGFPSNTVNHIYKDKKGKVWVATGEGLVRMEKDDNFTIFSEKDGIHNSHIRAIAEDASGSIWFSSISGLGRYLPDESKFYSYLGHDGVQLGDFMSGSVARDAKGWLYFGSQNGVSYFDPAGISTQTELPPVVITGFSVYRDQPKISDSDLDIPVNSKIELNHDQSTFKISFNTLDYSLSQLVEYSYMLKGVDDLWYNTEGENSVTFRNVPPGNYEFILRARIKNQEWSEELSSIPIVVRPPWWLSWWAKVFYLLALGGAVGYFLQFYKRKLHLETSLTLEKRNHQQDQELHSERIRFFTNITHELRTPLTLILGPLEDLEVDKTLSRKHSAKVSVIHKSASRLLGLINQILEFQKTENRSRKLAVYKGNLARLVEEVGLKYEELNMNQQIEFKMLIRPEQTHIFYDAEMITTILENLLSNAFKYTQSGSICLNLREVNENGINYTEIEVKDTGRGIPAASIPKIFERYYQVAEDARVSGTGIGLSLVHNLVLIHEGHIFVESKVGKGSSFRVRIQTDNTYPEAKHLDLVQEKPQEELMQETGEDRQIVLVIEDNHDIRDYIFRSLSDDYIVYTAANGKEGLQEAYSHIPDIIITDIMMPELDGFELSKILKADVRTSHIPIVMLTAKDSIQDRKEGYDIGVESYLTKPFSAGLLQSRLENILEARKRLAESVSRNTVSKKTIINESLTRIDNEFIEKVTDIIEKNIDSDKIDVVFIAESMNMSHSTLYRKIKALSGVSVNEFIRKVRLSNAEKLLLTGKYTISELSFMVGINSIVYFRQCFKEEFGMTPSEYLKKLKKD